MSKEITPFEQIRRVTPTGNEYWSSRDFARVLGYTDYRNFEAVIEKARTACFNSGQRIEDHFVDITDMVDIGSTRQFNRQKMSIEPTSTTVVATPAPDTKKRRAAFNLVY